MITTACISTAKINWYIRVLDRRADGFHDIETVFHEISLADTIEFQSLTGGECVIEGMPFKILPEQNLICRAWSLMREQYPGCVGGLRARINKIIPAGGGLGGGSSNAAFTLKAVNQLYSLQLDDRILETLAARLGSDAPFFIRGGCATGRGRGELLEPVCVRQSFHVVIVTPHERVPTTSAYARLDAMTRPATDHALEDVASALAAGDPARLSPLIHNDFELVLADKPWFRRAVNELMSKGCLRAFLSGSGSAVVGLAENAKACQTIARKLQHTRHWTAWPAHTTCK
ncbi:MAG: 4-(cytidine 5'-diphospho)-2-C-methyl-D-erythritol kinase [Candidatus Sumerlaeota bacterium]|nr:4-(cytidine 5'-diphospho)-2-C-methyl-D-erythritol kinase [Candidatus Sumerlaeota bacterium]